MSRYKLAIVGGDLRELYLAGHFLSQGHLINLCGFDQFPEPPVSNIEDYRLALTDVDAVILPLAGTTEALEPKAKFSACPPKLNHEFFASVPAQAPVFVGWARDEMREDAARANCKLIEIAEDDELAILNSIPTAEGAIAIAMENTAITVHGSQALVFGMGRCGFSLARMLKGIGAETTVVARKAADLARAYEAGLNYCHYSDLSQIISNQELIFNTVPKLVLDAELLQAATNCQVIVDIASGRGGTDFEAARELGLQAILAPGLPGKVAPVTAGKILTQVYPRLLKEHGVSGR